MKAVIYSRVSTSQQKEEGKSLDAQYESCLAKAKELGYQTEDICVLKEAWSGLDLYRPRLNELREWIRNQEIKALIVYDTHRFSRDPTHLLLLAEECSKAGVELHFIAEPFDNSLEGQLLNFVRGWASKVEVVRKRDYSIRGHHQRAKSGKIPIGQTGRCYGFTYIKGKGEGQGIRELNEEQAKVVQNIFEWFVHERLKPDPITMRLDSMGIPTATGKKHWHFSTIRQILHNPAYIGKT